MKTLRNTLEVATALVVTALALVLLGGIALSVLAESQAANPSGSAVMGNCTKAQVATAQYLFVVSTPEHQPLSNVTITAGGISKETNSSGMATLPAVGLTVGVGLDGTESSILPGGAFSPALCLGSSYYHVLWLTVNAPNGTAPSTLAPQLSD